MAPTPTRILMLNTEHGWRGGEHQLQLLCRGLDAGSPTLTACQPASPLAAGLRDIGAAVLPLAMRGPLHLGAAWAIRRAIREHGITLVHAHTSHAHSLAALACRGSGVPLVVTRRVDFPLKRGWFSRWKYAAAVTRYAAVSQAVAGVLSSGGVDPARIEVIHDGIDFARFPPLSSTLREEFRLPAQAVIIGIIAQLTDHKDHRTLITAFAEVSRQRSDCWLLIVGHGELEGELRRLVGELALERVVFTGFRSDIANIMRGLDIAVLSSHLEGLGSSLMDAMYCSLPVLATRAGGIPELIVDGSDGLLVGVRDAAAMAAGLMRLAGDPELRRTLGAAAHATALKRFSASTMVAAYQALYRRLAG
jgi:glycosyltransferase involved in cell wall biosynthesis